MILLIINIKKYLKLFFSPLPPVDFDGVVFCKRFLLTERLVFTINKNNISFLNLFLLAKHILISIVQILYLPIIFIFYIFNFRILHINFDQIGAFVHQLDFIIKNNKLNKKYKLISLSPYFLKINNFIFQLYKNEVFFISNSFFYLILYPLINCRLTSLDPWPGETTNPNSKYNKVHSDYHKVFNSYKCNQNTIPDLDYKNFLEEKMIVNKKIISLHVRDDSFYNFRSYRNSNINSYAKTILYLLKKDFVVIRFVNLNSPKININNNKYIELETKTELDKKLQFLIIKNSYFFICNQSGPMNYNSILDTPFLLTNAIPINTCGVIKKQDRFIFKKFYDSKKKIFLNVLQIFRNNYHLYPQLCKKNKIKIIDNSEKEIFFAMKEMICNIKKKKFIANYRQKNFFKLLKRNNSIKFTHSYISKNFYC